MENFNRMVKRISKLERYKDVDTINGIPVIEGEPLISYNDLLGFINEQDTCIEELQKDIERLKAEREKMMHHLMCGD